MGVAAYVIGSKPSAIKDCGIKTYSKTTQRENTDKYDLLSHGDIDLGENRQWYHENEYIGRDVQDCVGYKMMSRGRTLSC